MNIKVTTIRKMITKEGRTTKIKLKQLNLQAIKQTNIKASNKYEKTNKTNMNKYPNMIQD